MEDGTTAGAATDADDLVSGPEPAATSAAAAPFWWWAAMFAGVANMVAAWYVMSGLGRVLRSLRAEGMPGRDLGQGPFAREGLTAGVSAAGETLAIWREHAAGTGRVGTNVAKWWLGLDTLQFAVLGYGFVSLMVLLLAQRTLRAADAAGTSLRWGRSDLSRRGPSSSAERRSWVWC